MIPQDRSKMPGSKGCVLIGEKPPSEKRRNQMNDRFVTPVWLEKDVSTGRCRTIMVKKITREIPFAHPITENARKTNPIRDLRKNRELGKKGIGGRCPAVDRCECLGGNLREGHVGR